MDSHKPYPVVPAPKPNLTQVYHDSFHQALSLRPSVASGSAEMEERDLFLMTQMQTPWARSNFAGVPPADQASTSVYGGQTHPLFPPHMTVNPPQPPLQPRPDMMLTVSVNHPHDHFQQQHEHHLQQQQQQQEITTTMIPQSSVGQTENETVNSPASAGNNTNTINSKEQKGKKRKHTSNSELAEKKRRCSNPLEWKKRKKKILRDKGEEYVTMRGKLQKAKCVQPIDCTKCRFRCSEKIPEEARQAIHKVYWSLASYERQRAFIAQHVEQNDIKQVKSKTGARREVANSFFFVHKRKEHRVCKAFFTKTLDITSKVVDYTMKKTECGVYVGRDERGRRDPVNKTKPDDAEFIHWHIGSFPTVDGARAKKNKNRKRYLSQDLNVGRMYNMYKDLCERTGRKPMGISVYRNIFNTDFNLAFQKPKKEHCASCKCGESSGKTKAKTACGSNSNNCSNNIQTQPVSGSAEPSVFFQ